MESVFSVLNVSFYVCCYQVKLVEQGIGYLVLGGLMTATLALLPFAFRLAQRLDMSSLSSLSVAQMVEITVGACDAQGYAFFFITTFLRVCLTGLFFFMMCVAERTYKQVSDTVRLQKCSQPCLLKRTKLGYRGNLFHLSKAFSYIYY